MERDVLPLELLPSARALHRAAIERDEATFARAVRLPPSMLLPNRVQFGFYSVLARLDARADYAAVERSFLR